MSNLSPAPGTPQTPYKAYAATVLALIVSFVTYWIADVDPFTNKEIGEAIVLALVGSGLTGGVTYGVANKAKSTL